MNLQGQVSYEIWLKLPKEVRDKLVQLFHIPRSGSTVVDYGPQGNVVLSDGYKPTDIEAITLEKMQALMDSDSTNFYQLFSDVIEHIDRLLEPKPQKIYHSGAVELYDDPTPGADLGEALKDVPVDNGTTVMNVANAPFCDQCASKGGRHLKVCPKYK